jgi:hypothetical protein
VMGCLEVTGSMKGSVSGAYVGVGEGGGRMRGVGGGLGGLRAGQEQDRKGARGKEARLDARTGRQGGHGSRGWGWGWGKTTPDCTYKHRHRSTSHCSAVLQGCHNTPHLMRAGHRLRWQGAGP